MSNYDRNYRFGAQVGQKAAAEIDQGLRAYMIGVYNYMTLGLGVTGLAALGTFMLANPAVRRPQARGLVVLRPGHLPEPACAG